MSRESTISRKSHKGKPRLSSTTSALRPPKPPRSRGHEIRSADPRSLGFADLPGELRNLVYAFALTLDDGELIRLNAGGETSQRLALSLLTTCKAIHREVIGILFRQNKFQVDVREANYDALPQCFRQMLYTTNGRENCRDVSTEVREWVKDFFQPGLATTLRLMPAKSIAMVITWIFAYHVATEGLCAHCTTHASREEPAELEIRLDLLPKVP